MTREEALQLMPNFRNYGVGCEKGYLLDCLKELGLIKLDNVVFDTPSTIIRAELQGIINAPMHKADAIVNALYQSGYKIVKK